MADYSPLEIDLRARAERLATVERLNWTLEERQNSFPPAHIDRIYQELRVEIANGSTTEEAHSSVMHAIQTRMKRGKE